MSYLFEEDVVEQSLLGSYPVAEYLPDEAPRLHSRSCTTPPPVTGGDTQDVCTVCIVRTQLAKRLTV